MHIRRFVFDSRLLKHVLLSLVVLVIGGTTALFIAARWHSVAPQLHAADVIVSLGGEPPYRAITSAALYQQGFAPEIWFTGDVPAPGNTVSTAKADAFVALQRRVPAKAMTLLPTTSTWEDAREIAGLAQQRGIRSVLIVTSWYHSRRALCTIIPALHEQAVAVYYQPADTPYNQATWWQSAAGWSSVTRESVAALYYALRYGTSLGRCET